MKKILLFIALSLTIQTTKAQADAFITTWVTTTGFETLNLTAQADAPNYNINWGDGFSNTYTATQVPSHTFVTSGEHTVSFTGTFPHLTFSGQTKLKAVQQWGTQKWTSMEKMFAGCSTLNSFPVQAPDLSLCTNMNGMFFNATSFNHSIEFWNVSNVSNMGDMFYNATAFNQPIGSWDVSKVNNLMGMFHGATSFNQPIGSWNVSNVTNMYYLFWDAKSFNQPIGSWNVSNVIYMSQMFKNAIVFNQPIGSWDVSKVTTMYNMFWNATAFDQNIGSWNVSKVTNMDGMFKMAKLSSDNYDALLIGWATRGVNEGLQGGVNFDAGYSRYSKALSARNYLTNTRGWIIIDIGFENGLLVLDSNGVTIKWTGTTVPSPSFVLANPRGTGNEWFVIADNSTKDNITNYAGKNIFTYFTPPDESNPIPFDNIVTTLMTNMSVIFAGATSFNQPIHSWDVSNVTDMSQMFGIATPFNQSLGSWNVSKVTNMSYMFDRAISFNQPIGSWNVSNVTNMDGMFTGAIDFNQPIGSWNVSNVTNMSNMFRVANAFNQPIDSWDVSNVTTMSYMFHRATSFNQPIGSWDVSKVTDMSYMFSVAEAFNQPIDSWNVSNVTRMSFMFYYQFLSGNTIINGNCVFDQPLGSWNLSKVTNMSYFLRGGSLSTANYDATLIGWAKTYNNQTSYVDFSAGGSQYCNGITARQLLRSKGLAITDGGFNCDGLGTEAFEKSSTSLYPNPTSSILNIKVDANQPYTITDSLGKIVLKGKLNEDDTTINVEHLSKGIYFIKVANNKAGKFIKE